MPIFCRINYFFHVSFSFFMHSLLKEKKPEAKRQKRVLYIGSGRVGSGRVGSGRVKESLVRAVSTGSSSKYAAASACRGQQQLLSCSLRSLARSLSIPLLLELSLPFASSSPFLCVVLVSLCVHSGAFFSLWVCALNACTHRYSVLFLLW